MSLLMLTVLNAAALSLAVYALATAASHYLKLPDWKALAAGIVALGAAGFAHFWILFFDTALAPWAQAAFLGACIVLLVFPCLRRSENDLRLIWPCLAMLAGGVALIAWAVLLADPGKTATHVLNFAANRWTSPLTGDNEIPYYFANQLRDAQITAPMFGDWLSSDRPPLQTGMYLLLGIGGDGREAYQASSTAIQMLALPAVWILARAMGAGPGWSLAATAAIWATPLTLLNGLFVWPKLLAGGYVAIAAAIHFAAPKGERTIADGVIAGSAAALGMLSHGASAFALAGFAVAALAMLRLFTLRYVAAAAIVAILMYLPWMFYTNVYDPPGNRLMKWHLAASMGVDDRSLTQALADGYGKLTPATWADGRIQNLVKVIDPKLDEVTAVFSGQSSATKIRDLAFEFVPWGLGLLVLALWALPGFFFIAGTRALAGATLAALVVWAVLLLGPGQTATFQGSFFPQMALAAMAARVAASGALASKIGNGLLTLHLLLVGVLFALP